MAKDGVYEFTNRKAFTVVHVHLRINCPFKNAEMWRNLRPVQLYRQDNTDRHVLGCTVTISKKIKSSCTKIFSDDDFYLLSACLWWNAG
jgi:hypothetical protein